MSISPSDEGFWARTGRKNRENPFIFPAVAATIFGLWRMSKAMYKSDAIGFQMAQRWRVGAQVAALAAFGGGVM
ncbi:hypothetical protein DFS34DRAFT_628538 [Phlyctochytrium arcticum]|nr:hypothetical protein DFS34DRAFT_628538 [Phlyctochytrium arcticum]